MYQELSNVYDQCNNSMQQSSFDSDDGYNLSGMSEGYAFDVSTEANIPSHLYMGSSSSPGGYGSQGDLTQIGTLQQKSSMVGYGTNQLHHQHDLPTIVNRPDLQWMTTSNNELRTQSPTNSSSPGIGASPMYINQSSPPNRALYNQGSFEDNNSSSATITHHQLVPGRFASPNVNSPSVQRTGKKSANAPTKPKGTPGRKRKFQDYELTPAEASRRHIRRERNKVAAAKCRNRRRELTDHLQGETDHLENCQNKLHHEIMTLQQEKEHLEFLLATHTPNCKAQMFENGPTMVAETNNGMMRENIMARGVSSDAPLVPPPEIMEDLMSNDLSEANMMDNDNIPKPYYFMQESSNPAATASSDASAPHMSTQLDACYQPNLDASVISNLNGVTNRSFSRRSIPTSCQAPSITLNLDVVHDSLNTPVCTLNTPSHSSGIFTFPSTPFSMSNTAKDGFSFPTSMVSTDAKSSNLTLPVTVTSFPSFSTRGAPHPAAQNCSAAHRRRSSSDSYHSQELDLMVL